ncbi:acetylglutamate kinase [Flavobacterium qiangtangense]|uniref:Acetylglutamate kinase n=1 Tax=Flavobacterium qiangtangense TaxID=1442595 RepID=A0ABW1PJ93_9FLAO
MENKPKITIVKIGGNIIDNEEILNGFLKDFAALKEAKILIHGGGKTATKIAEKLNLKPLFSNGRRITDKAMLDVTVMTYSGLINKQIVAKLQALKTNSIGFSGADGNAILSEKRTNSEVDFGFVGDVISVNKSLISTLLLQNITPVFSAITHDGNGQLLNTNADTIASEIAIALSETFDINLIYCFEKKGVLADSEDDDSVIETLNFEKYQSLKAEKAIHSGMLPKLENCFKSIENGVQNISIGNQNILKDSTIYTKIKL